MSLMPKAQIRVFSLEPSEEDVAAHRRRLPSLSLWAWRGKNARFSNVPSAL